MRHFAEELREAMDIASTRAYVAAVRKRYAEAATRQRDEIGQALRKARADHLRVRTDEDWLTAVVHHVERRRAMSRAQVLR